MSGICKHKNVWGQSMNTISCPGFQAAGIAAGIKPENQKDLGLIYSERPATVAGVFTRNRVKAAPVRLTQAHCEDGYARAIVANSGNANCCTGDQGMRDAMRMSAKTAEALDIEAASVLVASTGVIGEPLPVARIEDRLPPLVAALGSQGLGDFAEAIMTTDTEAKLVDRRVSIGGVPVTICGVAKGAGMICPDMATLLCFVCSDVQASAARLQALLERSVAKTLNRITVDGDTSTNDMALLLANGVSGVTLTSEEHQARFQSALDDVLGRLARRLVQDGEGATKLIEVRVTGAASQDDAYRVAYTIAHSNLFKTACFGEDANWGRILAAAGRAGVALDPERVDIFFNDVQMVKGGFGCGPEAEAAATRVLQQAEFAVRVELNQGHAVDTFLTCDFSIDYVKINADYRT
jgi:glutamate N-acetyltransferase/amino-acid N-acetyltransferase